MFPSGFIEAVSETSLIGVSAGNRQAEALEIWVVAVGGRLFARSWGLSERSWYATFLTGAPGTLTCRGQRIAVIGRRPPDAEELTPSINAEYLRKYDRGENSKYARGIIEKKHVERTLEFLPLSGLVTSGSGSASAA